MRTTFSCPRWAVISGAIISCLLCRVGSCHSHENEQIPNKIKRWLVPQKWIRDTDGPVISLGKSPAFDDTHVFAPCVAFEKGKYQLWYSGSRGTVAERVFRLGLALSPNGKSFTKFEKNPVYEFGDGRQSILTATLLRNPDGSLLRENDKLRMWFSSTDFQDKSGLHTLRETFSADGIKWAPPSPILMKHVYAPTILKEGNQYRMWYTDVSANPWVIRHARSSDGKRWKADKQPVLKIGQPWEQGRLFYPTVLKADGVYLMWYGSYWSAHRNKTALGLAVSLDGLRWFKNPHNPVLRPDGKRPWESHYTTSQSVLRMADGSFRIWYASRKRPPFVNKYFAICTARWEGLR